LGGKSDSSASIRNKSQLAFTAALLGIKPNDLMECLLFRKNVIKGEEFRVPYTFEQATDCRDALVNFFFFLIVRWEE